MVNPAEPKISSATSAETSDAEVQQALASAISNAPSGSPSAARSAPPFLSAAVLMESQMPTLMGDPGARGG
ncbi:hypothetical protein MJ585_10655 [Klebsiella pneumoniae]|nr:hypothetical protein MJ585_10655 [Klebsiella pneumoniae]